VCEEGKDGRDTRPSWLQGQAPRVGTYGKLKQMKRAVRRQALATVCEEAKCPNIAECWGGESATATIMLMGDTCTRGCRFCAIKTSRAPPPLDPAEPQRVAEQVATWGVDYIVLTSVDRDDVEDGGAAHIAETVRAIKRASQERLRVEVLAPDFSGRAGCVDEVAGSGVDVFAHNVETVERLQKFVRDHRAGYAQSLLVLERAKHDRPDILTKTSLMLGIGEHPNEVRTTLRDLRDHGVDIVSFGQYLRPTNRHLPVHEYVHPDTFAMWEEVALAMGFLYAPSGPLVRSSYRAGEYFAQYYNKKG